VTKLYELAGAYEQLRNAAEAGEDISGALAELNDDLEVKAGNVARLLASWDGDVEAFKTEEKRISARRKAIEANVERLREYVRRCMSAAGITSIKAGTFSVTLAAAADRVIVDDEKALPAECWREKTTREVDKALIAKMYRDHGEIPPGCRIEPNTSLRIR
jgi:hypothetical protein